MNFDRIRFPGFWIPGSVILPEELEALDDHQSKTVNAYDGSTHAPTAQIVLGGAGLYVSADAQFDQITFAALKSAGTFTVSSDAFFNVANGGLAQLLSGGRLDTLAGGELRIKNGGFINVQAGGSIDVYGAVTVKSGGGISIQSGSLSTFDVGSTIIVSGIIYFSSSTWPKLSPDRTWERHSLRICNLTYDTTTDPEPAKPDAWIRPSDLAGGAECIQTRPIGTSGKYHWIELLNLPDGGIITNVTITTLGNSGTASVTVATYQVVRWQGSGAKQSMSATVTDVHSGANWTTALLTTTIPINANSTIDKAYRYALIVFHPFEFGLNGAMRIYDVKATGTASELRL